MILIDSDIAVDLLREHDPALNWFASLPGSDQVLLSGYSALELVAGARTSIEMRRVQVWLSRFGMVWLSQDGCDRALEQFARFRLSHGVGILDVFIAQTALDLGHPLHTFNTKHYRFIEGLALNQPYARQQP